MRFGPPVLDRGALQVVNIEHIGALAHQHVPDVVTQAPWPARRVPIARAQAASLRTLNLAAEEVQLMRGKAPSPDEADARGEGGAGVVGVACVVGLEVCRCRAREIGRFAVDNEAAALRSYVCRTSNLCIGRGLRLRFFPELLKWGIKEDVSVGCARDDGVKWRVARSDNGDRARVEALAIPIAEIAALTHLAQLAMQVAVCLAAACLQIHKENECLAGVLVEHAVVSGVRKLGLRVHLVEEVHERVNVQAAESTVVSQRSGVVSIPSMSASKLVCGAQSSSSRMLTPRTDRRQRARRLLRCSCSPNVSRRRPVSASSSHCESGKGWE